MKKLSDYKGEEAIELWADLLDPFIEIIGDPNISGLLKAKKPPVITAREILKNYKKQATEILLRIDPTPVNGLNILIRLISLLTEIGNDPTMKSFFESSAEAEKGETPSGSAMVNTEGKET